MANIYSETPVPQQCASLLMVTMRDPVDDLFVQLQARQADWQAAGIKSVQALGDACAPGTVAAAVYAGHRAARELDATALALDEVPFKREMIAIAQ